MIRRATRALFRRRYGNETWDGVLRVTGVLALVGIPLAVLVPEAGGLVGFALVTVWVNGPISPLLPSTYEPILMLFGRAYNPLMVAAVGTAGTIYVEYLNYHLYQRVLGMDALEGLRERRIVRRVVGWFSRAPFFTIWLCSWSIFPYWPMRITSPLAGYPVRRHLTATFLGRFPRIWFFAALGAWWGGPIWVLGALAAAAVAVAITVWLVRRSRGRIPDAVALAAAPQAVEG